MASPGESAPLLPGSMRAGLESWLYRMLGYGVLAICVASAVSLLTWSFADPSFTHATNSPTRNLLGPIGAIFSDLIMQLLGLAGVFALLPPLFWGLQLITMRRLDGARAKLMLAPVAVVLLACAASSLPKFGGWPLPYSLGGVLGDQVLRVLSSLLAMVKPERASAAAGLFCCAGGLMLLMTSLGLSQQDLRLIYRRPRRLDFSKLSRGWQRLGNVAERASVIRREPVLPMPQSPPATARAPLVRSAPPEPVFEPEPRVTRDHRIHTHHLDGDLPVDDLSGDEDGDADGAKRMAEIFAPEIRRVSPGRSEASSLVAPAPISEEPDAARCPDPIDSARAVMSQDAAGRSPARHSRFARASAAAHRRPEHRPAEPAPWPSPEEGSPPPTGWRLQSLASGDDLYGRAVAIVLGDRKASTAYLQKRLAIGYMRAADLLERMEQEGILGAPVHNGTRPILINEAGSREI
jgi:DNA segregation ATPase FtsK/SpoIIIE-like protein